MNKKLYLISFFITLFVAILIIFFFGLFKKIQVNQPQYGYTATLKPNLEANLYYYTVNVSYPYVNTSPDNYLYILTNLKEKIELYSGKYDGLFLASKRLAEIQKWGNTLSMNTWEYLITDSRDMVEKFINEPLKLEEKQKKEKLVLAKNYLERTQADLETMIQSSNKIPEKKKELSDFSDKIVSDLVNKINLVVKPYDPLRLHYSLDGFESGFYNIKVSTASIPKYLLTDNHITLNNQTIDQDKNPFDKNILSFSNIIINNKSQDLVLQFNNIYLPVKDKNWLEQYDEKQKIFKYFLPVPLIRDKKNYLLNFQYRFSFPTMFFLGINVFENKENIQGLFFEPLFTNKKKLLKKIVAFDQNGKIYYHFVLISQYRIPAQELSIIDINFQPIVDPEIIFAQTSPIIVKKDFAAVKKPLVNFIVSIFKILAVGISLFILIYFKVFLKKLLIRLRFVFLFLAVVSIVFNIIIISWPSNVLFLPSLFFWILSLVGYKIEERISLYICLGFLILCPLFIGAQNTILAEKLAIYAYLFLLTGGIHSLISYFRTKHIDEKNY